MRQRGNFIVHLILEKLFNFIVKFLLPFLVKIGFDTVIN